MGGGINVLLTVGSNSLLINEVPYAKGSVLVRKQGELVGLYHVSQPNKPIVVEQNYSFYLSGPTTPFASQAALITFLDTNAF